MKFMHILILSDGSFDGLIAKELTNNGHDVCILRNNEETENGLDDIYNIKQIKEIQFDPADLSEVDMSNVDVFLAITSNDNMNITMSLIAQKIHCVSKVIAKLNTPAKKVIYNALNIETITPIQAEIRQLKELLDLGNYNVISVLDNNYEIIELLSNSKRPKSVESIEKKYSCIISGLTKNGLMNIPKKNDLIEKGERMICTIEKKQKEKLINSFNKGMWL